ncbi:putative cell survival pathways protein [Cladochytrium tenue]|nr:putative cell survival pathways protein [Cladochytrium tenue]
MWAALGFGGSEAHDGQNNANPTSTVPTKPIDRHPNVFEITSIDASAEKDLAWVVDHSQSTEGQTFYLHLADGGFTFLQVTARFYGADGVKHTKSLSLSSTSFSVSSDRLSVECENVSLKRDEVGNYHIRLDCGSELQYDLKFVPTDKVVKINDGLFPYIQNDPSNGYIKASFAPMADVSGTIIVNGIEKSAVGSGFCVNAFQSRPQCVGKWNFINIQSSNKDGLLLYEFEMPEGYNYDLDIVSQGIITRNGKTIAVTLDNRSVQLDRELDSFSGYKIPKEFKVSMTGKTCDGSNKDVRVELSLKPIKLLDKIDVLSELPWMLRTIIQTFVTAPFVYSWYEEKVPVRVHIGDEVLDFKDGRMFLEISYLTTMP